MLFCLWNQTKAYTLSGELHNIFQGLCIIRKAQRSPIPLVEFENDIATILVDFYRWWPLKVLAASSCHRCLQFTVNLTRAERMKEFGQVELFFKKTFCEVELFNMGQPGRGFPLHWKVFSQRQKTLTLLKI